MSTDSTEVLRRFAEADLLLRKAHSHIDGLASARAHSEATVQGLAAVLADVSAFTTAAQTAVETLTGTVQDLSTSLGEILDLGGSLDTVGLTQAVAAVDQRVSTVQESERRTDRALTDGMRRTAEASEVLGVKLLALSDLTGHVGSRIEDHLRDDTARRECEHRERRELHLVLQKRDERLTAVLAEIVERLTCLQRDRDADQDALAGIRDVLPRRSRRKLDA